MTQRMKLKPEAEIEMLYAQLDVKEAMIKNYTAEIETQRQQIEIAVKALKNIIKKDMYNLDEHRVYIEETLKQIKELDK